jgi:hypothetical protein|tara:strand:- start:808 stop:1566 length:759 start_codon:yes stop_codon:yes gene_type:complete
MQTLQKLSDNLVSSFLNKFTVTDSPSVEFVEDMENSENPLGRTASYEPATMKIVVYTSGRHPKDILRSLSHELVHHMQNCRGDLGAEHGTTEEGYAQSNEHLREMEREAYESGNLFFRDWEDNLKSSNIQLYETIYRSAKNKGDRSMSTKDWKNQELNTLLMEKWGYKAPEKQELNEDVVPVVNLIDNYEGLQKEFPSEEALEEEEEEQIKADPHPIDPQARIRDLEEDDEAALREMVSSVVREILSEKSEG